MKALMSDKLRKILNNPKTNKKLQKRIIQSCPYVDNITPEQAKEAVIQVKKNNEKNKRLLKVYGISLDEYNKKLEEQGGVCACCKQLHPRMCVDHLHIRGFKKMLPEEKRKYVRGICCFMCNVSFKGFEKTLDGHRNRQQLLGTYQYFLRYPLKGEIE